MLALYLAIVYFIAINDMKRGITMPDELEALRELSGLTALLFHAFPMVAAERVLPYFRLHDLEVDAGLAAHMLRHGVRAYLKQIDLFLVDEEESFLADLSNSGIAGVYRNQWGFKVLRSKNGGIPLSGDSERRRAFMCQQISLFPFQQRPNAVLLWEFLDKDYTEFDLKLALPTGVNPDGTVEVKFIVQVPWLLPFEESDATVDSPSEIAVQRKAPSNKYGGGVPSQIDLR